MNDPQLLEALAKVKSELDRIGIPFLLIGAAARDLIYLDRGLPLPRATLDLDIAILVDSWSRFEEVRRRLISVGQFRETVIFQRLRREEIWIDIIPFGPIAGSSSRIRWPNGDCELNVMGMMEAFATAEIRPLPGAGLKVNVPTLQMMAVLKLIAWSDARRPKDAIDLLSLISVYERMNDNRLFQNESDLLGEEAFDLRRASLRLLGRDMASAADPKTREFVITILDHETREGSESLITSMLKIPYAAEDAEKVRQDPWKLRQGLVEARAT